MKGVKIKPSKHKGEWSKVKKRGKGLAQKRGKRVKKNNKGAKLRGWHKKRQHRADVF